MSKDKEDTNKSLRDLSCLTKSEIKNIQLIAKVLAKGVRDNIEDFHVKHIPDKHMKELNTLTRDAIFSFLIMMKKTEKGDKLSMEILALTQKFLPKYWEDCKMI